MRTSAPPARRWESKLGWLFMRTPAQGARTAIWAAQAPELESVTGKVFGNVLGNVLGSGWRNELAIPAVASDPAAGQRIYERCEQLAAEPQAAFASA